MRRRPVWTRNSRSLAILLLAVSVPPVVAAVWLGLELLAQDRDLIAQRDLERRQAAVPAIVQTLHKRLDDVSALIIFTARSRSGNARREIFVRTRPPVFLGAISSDGRQIGSFNDDVSAVTVISLATGEEREVFRLPVPKSALGGPAAEWTSDGKALLIRISAGGGPMTLWLVPIDGGQPRQIDVGVSGVVGFARLSASNQLAFTAGVERRELRVLEGFLPPPVGKR